MLRDETADGAATSALTELFPNLENSFKHACRQAAVSQQPVSYRGQVLTPSLLRRMGNCPPQVRANPVSATRPRAGRATTAIRLMSWNAGHLGQLEASYRGAATL